MRLKVVNILEVPSYLLLLWFIRLCSWVFHSSVVIRIMFNAFFKSILLKHSTPQVTSLLVLTMLYVGIVYLHYILVNPV